MLCPVLELAQQLIKRPSISPDDSGCQEIIIARLKALGFIVETMNFGETSNFWAYHGTGYTLAFSGHTDVVPIGDIQYWEDPPFKGVLKNGMLYGRGASDMKGSLAAMIVATERFIIQNPDHQGRLAFLITSDEESSGKDGTTKVVDILISRKEQLDYCLIGEPSSKNQVGDVVKNGRRGSLTANLIVEGTQGHVAYPHLVDNPVHKAISALKELISVTWDQGNIFFPPTTMQITSIHAGTEHVNVTPSNLKVQINFRFSSELTSDLLRKKVDQLIQGYGFRYHIDWFLSGHPFFTPCGKLMDTVVHAVQYYKNINPRFETSGGTSDGRFISRMGAQIVELGPVNNTIHKVNECVSVSDLQILSYMYKRIIEKLLL